MFRFLFFSEKHSLISFIDSVKLACFRHYIFQLYHIEEEKVNAEKRGLPSDNRFILSAITV